MKKIMLMAALMTAMTHAQAQRVVEETDLKETEKTAVPTTADDGGMKRSPSTGDLFDGLTRPITFDRMIPPYALEVTFYKTVHIIFPATIKYVDLGSADIIAGKADGSENVLRVKAALRDFSRETNLAVITEDGSYYTFNVKYADEPTKLNIEMKDFLHDGEAVNRPNN
ncbi:DUF4138 domain-containing protein, partial [Bacteroides sp. ET71]|uniref:DUF4138 domain-containing protein n=1 Tax=Bacteroides sp. ET71 TaxID=2939421 RepID=UPI00201366B0